MARHSSSFMQLARRGAEHRYAELKVEIAALVKHFPHLAGKPSGRTRIDVSAEPAATIDKPRKRRRRGMSAAQRRLVSERMKKYWAARRSAKKG